MANNISDTYSDDDIERAMATVARVIELYGDSYWPILERLESELEDRRAKSARLSKHLKRFRTRAHPVTQPRRQDIGLSVPRHTGR